jgi:hypothetical protein
MAARSFTLEFYIFSQQPGTRVVGRVVNLRPIVNRPGRESVRA